ncbi:serine/threonine-protein phosphatase 2A regulatory subunit pppA-like [Tropilaelaps mercedesae]|uniref:Serine/threonine-protein phosphatase 2A regulatory subunit pppA-like n=1 Tax=Tropilaelaps mercedesae TaxID=418985 RepID=A0A1V9XQR4_9ACAR|nr:serine/threonine-protein phosphatase 2A regulatory subunit pppA-like [Tropilaelaps mercedesae]
MSSLSALAKEVGEHQLDEVDKRILELRKIPLRASQLGPLATRNSLLPMMTAGMADENERVVREYAKILSQMIEEVGGEEHIDCLFEQLKQIINMAFMNISYEDREHIAHAIITLTESMRPEDVDRLLVPLIEELSQDYFLKKCLCAPLLPTAYQKSVPQRQKIYHIFIELCRDSADVVVQAASTVITMMIEVMDTVELDLQDIVKKLATEASIPSTRMNAVTALVDILAKVSNERRENLIQTVLRSVIHDKADEVRVLLAAKMTRIQANVGYPLMKSLVKFVVGHLEKGGTKVKVKAIENFAEFLRGFPDHEIPGLVNRFQCIKELAQPGDRPEKTENVRVALATTLTHLALIVPGELYSAEYVPVIEDLMTDDSAKVREALVTNIKPVVAVIGQDRFVSTFQEVVIEMGSHVNWRVRQSVLNAITVMSFPSEVVGNLVSSMLKDECFELRAAAASHVRDIITKYPQSHVVDRILRLILEMANNKDKFTLRITSLKALECSMGVIPQRFMDENIYTLLERLGSDRVGNVRLNAARCIATVLLLPQQTEDTVLTDAREEPRRTALLEQLKKLAKDDDFDVKRTASKKLAFVQGRQANTELPATSEILLFSESSETTR